MHENRRRLPRPATVLAAIAVFAALAGTATAANSLIKGSEIKAGTITAKQLKNKTITTSKLSKATVNQLQGAKGATGPKGEPGERGPQGERGPAGIVAPLFGDNDSGVNIADGDEAEVLALEVPAAGTYVISAKTNAFAVQADLEVTCWIEADGDTVDTSQWTSDGANARQPLPLQAVAAASPSAPIELHCAFDDGNGSVSETKLTAIPVG